MVCINIGDATRSLNGQFSLYPNHARVLSQLLKLGFQSLPVILWRKQTNAPNKFMGSDMLPPGAYVTLEHEYILIMRKGSNRKFKKETERQNKRDREQFRYTNRHYHFSVKTRQETEIFINPLTSLQTTGGDDFEVTYSAETAQLS